MRSPAARALAVVGATALAISGTVLLTAVPAHADENYEWDYIVPHLSHNDKSTVWSPMLTNSTGEAVQDVTVTLAVSVPDGKQAPVHIELEDPNGNLPDAPCDLAEDSRSATCEVDLEPGTNEFQLFLLRDREVGLDDNDTVGIHVKAAQGDTELAAADGQLTISHDPDLDRVEFHDFPKEVRTDQTRPNGAKWSFTITNDSGEDAMDGVITIELSSAGPPGLKLNGLAGECMSDSDTSVTCAEISIPDGESETVDMELNADGTTENLAEKVTVSVDMFAANEEEHFDVAYGEANTRAVVADGSGNGSGEGKLPVTGSSLTGYLTAGAAVILLGAGMLFLTRRRAARQ